MLKNELQKYCFCFRINSIFAAPNKKRKEIMSKVCELTGKRAITGHKISHSNIKTKKKFYPNLIKKTFFVPEENKSVTLKISTSALKNITKNGIYACLKEAREKGYTLK
jgi:large subunit ribosomal protein L28